MFFDRGDICEAYYLFLNYYHEGQFSESYKRLCKLCKYFKPSPILRKRSLTHNGKAIYNELVRKHKEKDKKTKEILYDDPM